MSRLCGVPVLLSALILLLSAGGYCSSPLTAGQTAFPEPAGLLDPLVLPKTQAGSLLESPVPFYHDFNLTAMFPVGKTALESAEKKSDSGKPLLTIEDCVKRALEDSPNHQKVKENSRASIGDLLTAWGAFIPTVNSNYSMGQSNQSRSFVDAAGIVHLSGGIAKNTNANLNFNYSLFARADKFFVMKNAYLLRTDRLEQIQSSELGVVDQVHQAYFNVLRNVKLLVAANRTADRSREQLRLAEARFSVGSVTKLDVLQAQIDLQNKQLSIVQYQNSLATARMDLNKAMGGRINEEYELVDEFDVREVNLDVDGLVKEASDNHPDVQSLKSQIKRQQNNLWMGRLAYLPTIGASAGYQRSEEDLSLIPRKNKGRGISLYMSWNILDSFARFSQNRSLEVSLNNLQYDMANLRLTVERNVRGSYLDLFRLYQSNLALKESENLASQSLELMRERYRLGAASLLDLRQAEVDFSLAEVNYINSIYDFHIALSTLSRQVGRSLAVDFGY
jgi:outer membrane protein